MRDLAFLLAFLPMPFVGFVYPWAGMLLWGWLALLSPHRDLWGFASTLPYNQIIAIATIAGWLVSNERKAPHLDATLCLILALFGLATLSAFYSLSPELTWPKWDEFSKTVIYVALLGVFLTTKTRLHAFVWLVVGCIGFYGVKGGALFILSGGGHQFSGPPSTMIGDRNHLALAILMAIPLMNYLRLHSANVWIRRGLVAAMVLSVLAVVGTYSRGGFVGLIAMGGVLWWRSQQKLLTLLAVLAVAASLAYVAPEAWLARMRTIETAEKADDSFKGRLIAWQTYWAVARDRPLTGAGMYALNNSEEFFRYMPYETGIDFLNDKARAAHSIYFQVIGELGFPAFAVYLLIAGTAMWNCWRLTSWSRHHPDSAWLGDLTRMIQVSFVAFFVAGAALSVAFYDLYFSIVVLCSALRRWAAHAHNPATNRNSSYRLAEERRPSLQCGDPKPAERVPQRGSFG